MSEHLRCNLAFHANLIDWAVVVQCDEKHAGDFQEAMGLPVKHNEFEVSRQRHTGMPSTAYLLDKAAPLQLKKHVPIFRYAKSHRRS